MRLGIRLQLLLALGTLLVLAFLPLFFAVASLTRATMTSVRESNARALGRAIAGHITAARACRGADELKPLLDAQLGQEGVAAVGMYDPQGSVIARAGEAADSLPGQTTPGREELATIQTNHGAALLVVVPDSDADTGGPSTTSGSVAALVRTDPSTIPSAPLVRLVALYTGIVALALLVFAYFAMTRLVVQPIDRLSRAAGRVAGGARRLEVPREGAAELTDLGASLSSMTARLLSDEEALRTKIAEIERYAAELKRTQEQLVRSERLASVGRLSAGLAHEIGNPIAAILGLLQLLLDGGLHKDEERDFLERIKRETERIHGVVRSMLDFARPTLRRGSRPDAESHGNVAHAVAEVIALVKPQKAFRRIELVEEIAPDLPRVLLAHDRIIQVLLNLLLNAADALRQEGGRVTVRAQLRPDGTVRVEVEDNGTGIAPEVRDKLFEPFVTTKDVGEGTGLGLAVCQGLVEAAGGTISAESGKDGGARMIFDVPAEAPEVKNVAQRRKGART